MSDERLFIFATLKPKAGKEAELETLLRGMCGPSRAEKGCVIYNLYKAEGGAPSFHFFECWRNAAALDAHRQMPHYKDFRARLGELVTDPPAGVRLQGVDVV